MMLSTCCGQVKPRGEYVALIAKRSIMAGEQLEISYGALSNDFLLLDYGFTVSGNPHDRVSLRFGFELLQVSVCPVHWHAAEVQNSGSPQRPTGIRDPELSFQTAVARQHSTQGTLCCMTCSSASGTGAQQRSVEAKHQAPHTLA